MGFGYVMGRARVRAQQRVSKACVETLEERRLLAVTASEYASIRAEYPEFSLPSEMGQINVIEITPDQLNVASLKNAIAVAGTTDLPDLIVARTSSAAHTVTYALPSHQISIDVPLSKGAVTLVGFGTERLTLDAAGKSRVLCIGSVAGDTEVRLGGLTITGGRTSADGGGILQYAGSLVAVNLSVTGNTAQNGGGIQTQGVALLSRMLITGNTAEVLSYNGNDVGGGGVHQVAGTLTLQNSVISGNSAGGSNGGGLEQSNGTMVVDNCVFSGNSALAGGGLLQYHGTATLSNLTIAGNTAGYSGGLEPYIGAMTLYNSIIAMNTSTRYPGDDIGDQANVLVGSNNLVRVGEGQLKLVDGLNGNMVGSAGSPIDPLFVSMEGTDWTQWDLRLQGGSPAVDTGANAWIAEGAQTDVAGRRRAIGPSVDMGAYESGTPSAPTGLVLSNALVQADRPAGRTVGVLLASAPDAGSVLTYSLVGGEGSTDNGLFQIVGSELRTSVMLSYPHAPLSIRVRATDQDGLWTEQAFALSVVEYNNPPTATFSSTGTVGTGDTTARVMFTNVHDSPGDMAGGFRYSYDFGNDGSFEVAGSSVADAVVPGSYVGVAGVVAIRGRVTDVRGAFNEYVTNLTVRARPTAVTGGPYDEPEGRPVVLSGSASGLMDGGSARYQWNLNYDGVTFNVDAEGQEATFSGEALAAGAVRIVALRVWDGDGVSSETATTTVRVVSAPPTATFGAMGSAMMGQAGRVAFTGVADSVADMAAGFTYSYDFDDDGAYEVVNSTSAEAEVPTSYLGSPGVQTVRGRIADQSGAFSEFEAELVVNPPMDWWPLYAGLSDSSRGVDTDGNTYTETTEYLADEGGGIGAKSVKGYGWNTKTIVDHAVLSGTTWYEPWYESSTDGTVDAEQAVAAVG